MARIPVLALAVVVALALALAGRALADSAQEHYEKGAGLVQAHKFAEAEKEFEKAIALDPKHADSHKVLAALLKRDGKLEAAAKHLEAVLAVNPDDEKALRDLAQTCAQAAEKAAADFPPQTEKRNRFAGKAIESYEKIVQNEPDLVEALYNLGTIQLLAEKFAEAQATLARYNEKKPGDVRGLFNYAQAVDEGGAPPAKAIEAWEAYVAAGKAGGDAKEKARIAKAEGRIKELKKKK